MISRKCCSMFNLLGNAVLEKSQRLLAIPKNIVFLRPLFKTKICNGRHEGFSIQNRIPLRKIQYKFYGDRQY